MFHLKRHILKEGCFCKSSFHKKLCWSAKISKGTEGVLPNIRRYTRSQDFTNHTKILNLCVEIKCQLDATEVFIADLIACSTCFGHHYAHHQEIKSIIQWLLPVVFRAVVFKLLVWCGAEGYVSGLQDAAASCKPDT